MIELNIDIDKVSSLIHEPSSPTYADELSRRINNYNKLRVREMDYLIDAIRYKGLNDSAFLLFSRELRSIPTKGKLIT